MIADLKSLSDNFNISIITVWACIDCPLFFELKVFLVLGSDFQLKSGHFRYFVVRSWILFRPLILAGFF